MNGKLNTLHYICVRAFTWRPVAAGHAGTCYSTQGVWSHTHAAGPSETHNSCAVVAGWVAGHTDIHHMMLTSCCDVAAVVPCPIGSSRSTASASIIVVSRSLIPSDPTLPSCLPTAIVWASEPAFITDQYVLHLV